MEIRQCAEALNFDIVGIVQQQRLRHTIPLASSSQIERRRLHQMLLYLYLQDDR